MDSTERKLTERDLAVLAFEGSWWQASAPKDQAVRERFQLTEAEYVVVLDELIASEAALDVDPLLVRRLRRQPRQLQEHQPQPARRVRRLKLRAPPRVSPLVPARPVLLRRPGGGVGWYLVGFGLRTFHLRAR